MRILFFAVFSLVLLPAVHAKIISQVSLTTIETVTVKENKIILIGDGVLQSRMVTTQANKDSDFLIQGQPSVTYKVQGYAARFIITRPDLLEIPLHSQKEKKILIEAYNQQITQQWQRSVMLAERLQKGERISFSIKAEEVILRDGFLTSVTGRGNLN